MRLIRTHDASRNFLRAFSDDDYERAFGYAARVSVSSDPLQVDSDNDGLDDHRESTLGTDPMAVDSDTDGIGDGTEVDNSLDPTVYDFTPPNVTFTWIDGGLHASLTSTERIRGGFHARDPAGVANATVKHKRSVARQFEYDGSPRRVRDEYSYTVDVLGTGVDALTGFRTTIVVTDVNGNSRAVVAGGVQSGAVITAEELGVEKGPGAAELLGILAGFSAGAGQTFVALKALGTGTASFAKSVYNDYHAVINSLQSKAEAVTKLSKYDDYAAAIAKSYRSQMELANPYEEGTTRYQRFEKTYYAGILVFEITLTVAAGAASATKQTATASK